jgi:hypothetical protein
VVSLQGTAYDGRDIRIEQKSAKGLSNKIMADGARIQVRSGTVLSVVERKSQQYYVM